MDNYNASLAELLDRFSDAIWENGKHKQHCESFLLEINEIIISRKISLHDAGLIDVLISEFRNRNNKNSTINRKLSALYKLLRKAEQAGLIRKLPSYVRLQEKNGRIRFFSIDEERDFFHAMLRRNEDHYRLCVFLIDSGARIGEALALKWSDVDSRRATFWITKSGRSRTVPLTARASSAVFSVRSPGGPFADISYPRFLYDWNAVKKETGLEKDKQIVPHILRHTCASRLVQAGIDLRRVQAFLGHQTIQMTLRYAHLATNDLDQCVAALETFRQEKSEQEKAIASLMQAAE
ncbi:MAG: integrase [Ahrensia sp.]|nr:integrase [Ahrensia sp.]